MAADWAARYDAVVICPPQTRSRPAWPKARKRWLAGIRQVIESVNDRLLDTFGLDDERPHELSELQTRLAAKVALHGEGSQGSQGSQQGRMRTFLLATQHGLDLQAVLSTRLPCYGALLVFRQLVPRVPVEYGLPSRLAKGAGTIAGTRRE